MTDIHRSTKTARYFAAAACLALSLLPLPFCAPAAIAGQEFVVNGKVIPYEAGSLLNESVPLLQQNRNQEAVDKLLRAEQLAPDVANIHTNLGLGLAKLGRNQEALKELETSKSLDPNLAATWLTLGGLYQSQGMVNQAIDTYGEFITRFPKHQDAPKIASLITGLKKEVADGVIQPVSAAGGPADNYLAEMGVNAKRWPASKVPIRVFIHPGDGVQGYKPIYMDILGQSFAAWQQASQGGLAFQFVQSPDQADLDCSFTADASSFINRAEAGETYLYANSKGVVRGTIKLLTVPLVAALPVTENRMRQICLHEIGHAIGFGAHTTNPQDVMFYSTTVSEVAPQLSARDANSVRILYGAGNTNGGGTPLVNQPMDGRNPGAMPQQR